MSKRYLSLNWSGVSLAKCSNQINGDFSLLFGPCGPLRLCVSVWQRATMARRRCAQATASSCRRLRRCQEPSSSHSVRAPSPMARQSAPPSHFRGWENPVFCETGNNWIFPTTEKIRLGTIFGVGFPTPKVRTKPQVKTGSKRKNRVSASRALILDLV